MDPFVGFFQLMENWVQTFLQLLDTNVHRSPKQFIRYINMCEEFLGQLSLHSIPEPYTGSVAHRAFDPYVSKRLETAVPIRVLPIGSPGETWQVISLFLKGLRETSELAARHNLTTWKVRWI